jgi:hypothetical protein
LKALVGKFFRIEKLNTRMGKLIFNKKLEWVAGAERQNTQADNAQCYYRNQAKNDTRITVEETLPKHSTLTFKYITADPSTPESIRSPPPNPNHH